MTAAERRAARAYRVSVGGGRWRYFPTLEAAIEYAGLIWRRSGRIVAVETTP